MSGFAVRSSRSAPILAAVQRPPPRRAQGAQTRGLKTISQELNQQVWPHLHREMINFFKRVRPPRDSTAVLYPRPWERFLRREYLLGAHMVPCELAGFGPRRRFCLPAADVSSLAFDEAEGHLSYLFSGRMYHLNFPGEATELAVVSHVEVDQVERSIYFVRFARHIPGQITSVKIPLTLHGLLACPAYLNGYHVELASPVVRCQVAGRVIPPPLQVDVSELRYAEPYKAINLRSLLPHLPPDGSVRFHPDYDLDAEEIAWTYDPSTYPETPLPADWVDPNFIDKDGRNMLRRVSYRGGYSRRDGASRSYFRDPPPKIEKE
eukprot:GHVT01016028.1.p1 GENE.GHVT01016028.1~~GHVT01016028.1.p1  ORF type:complete len:321 (-),score=49.15 GHVT01016028.1:857-1819(-)